MTTLPVPEVPHTLAKKVKEDIELTIRAAERKYFSASYIRETFVTDDIDNPRFEAGVAKFLDQLSQNKSQTLFSLGISVSIAYGPGKTTILENLPVRWLLTCTQNADETFNYFYRTNYQLTRQQLVQILAASLGQSVSDEEIVAQYQVTLHQLDRLLGQSPIYSEYKQLDPVFVNYFLYAAEARKSRQSNSAEEM